MLFKMQDILQDRAKEKLNQGAVPDNKK